MKSQTLDESSMNFLLEVELSIKFIKALGFQLQISEAQVSNHLQNFWIATATISSAQNEIITQGLSLGGDNRQQARCLAIFEALERLFFLSLANPKKIQKFLVNNSVFEEAFGLQKCSYFKGPHIEEIGVLNTFNQEVLNSTGWAVGADVQSACERAGNELIERKILAEIKDHASKMIAVDVLETELGRGLTEISKDLNYEFITLIMAFKNKNFFVLSSMHDPLSKKTFYGSSYGNRGALKLLNKALEEVAMEFHFSHIAGDERIGEETEEFSHASIRSAFKANAGEKLRTVSTQESATTEESLILLNSDFTFRVFPVQNSLSDIRVFVAQAFIQ